MNWQEIYRCLGQAQDGFQRLEELGIPRDRAMAVVGTERPNDLEIASVIEQLRDLPDPDLEPKEPPSDTDGTDDAE